MRAIVVVFVGVFVGWWGRERWWRWVNVVIDISFAMLGRVLDILLMFLPKYKDFNMKNFLEAAISKEELWYAVMGEEWMRGRRQIPRALLFISEGSQEWTVYSPSSKDFQWEELSQGGNSWGRRMVCYDWTREDEGRRQRYHERHHSRLHSHSNDHKTYLANTRFSFHLSERPILELSYHRKKPHFVLPSIQSNKSHSSANPGWNAIFFIHTKMKMQNSTHFSKTS